LLAWDKDSYTERFLTLLSCTCILQPELVHLYQTSTLLPSHLPKVASVILRLLYFSSMVDTSNTFNFRFPTFPYSSCTHSSLSGWPMSNNITAFVWSLKSAYEGEHTIFGFMSLANFV
jgi:hypothetical protein